MRTATCCVCSQIDGQTDGDLIARLLPEQPYVRRVLLESEGFAGIPSLGPLVPGHSLLCPRMHLLGMAHLDSSRHAEFEVMCTRLSSGLQVLYGGQVHMFEHGAATESSHALCTVEHAHLHILPLPICTELDLGSGWLAFDGSLRSLRELCGGEEYVLYRAPDGQAFVLLSRQRTVTSQYMRRAVAIALGRADRWNWREMPDAAAADMAWRRYTAA